MRRRQAIQLAVVVLVAGVGLVGSIVASQATVRPGGHAVSGPFIYVDVNHCAPGNDGSPGAPLCTISAAASIVNPGQTVLVAHGTYNEAVSITRSGTGGSPISFVAVGTRQGRATVASASGPAFDVSGASNVVVRGFTVTGPIVVESSSTSVTIDEVVARTVRSAGVRIDGSASGVTVSRSLFSGSASAGVEVDAGASGVVVTGNEMSQTQRGVSVTDAPGTVVTGNTVVSDCGTGVFVDGTSTGVSIENNIVETAHNAPAQPSACAKSEAGVGISVSAASTSQSTAKYNLIDPASGAALYVWGDTGYTDLTAFSNATGQGAHDIAADPQLGSQLTTQLYPIGANSPAIDSADDSAAGALTTDMFDEPRADDPSVANSGTGIGYADRGAQELESPGPSGGQALVRKHNGGPFDTTATATVSTPWTTNGPFGTLAYLFDDAGNFPVDTHALSVDHTYRTAGGHCVDVFISFDNFLSGTGIDGSTCTTLGADYTPVTPTRLLDTRAGAGTPVAAGGELVLPIPSIGSVAAPDISAVVLNVTVTAPTGNGFLTVYPDGGSRPLASNLNFIAGQTVPNLVTVPLTDGKLRFFNGSNGTVHLVADLEGFYGATGSGFKALSPVRVLDTRQTPGPIAPGGDLPLDVSGQVPAGATAAILNVTVTEPTTAGFLTVYPAGQSLPLASNLNYVPGQTVPNLVVVPLTNGKVSIHNGSGGTVQVVADLAGFFGGTATGATDTFVPFGPVRVADTRDGTGGVHGPVQSNTSVDVSGVTPTTIATAPATAFVFNLTVTEPTKPGFLTAYPQANPRPTASNLNFTPGQTVPNLAVVPAGSATALFNGSPGTVQVVVDEEGYFIGPA